MSIGHCWQHALRIAKTVPRDQWAKSIDALPDTCEHSDCTAPLNCRKKIGDYLRMQYQVNRRLEKPKGRARR